MAKELTVGFVNPPKGLVRQYSRAKKEGLEDSNRWWWRWYLPRHFKPGAATRYGYEGRTEKYERRKLRTFGHADPLTFTGNLRTKMERRLPKVKIDKTGGFMNFRGMPRYTFILRDSPKWLELIATTEDEGRVMAKRYAKKFPQELDKHPTETRT